MLIRNFKKGYKLHCILPGAIWNSDMESTLWTFKEIIQKMTTQ